MVKTTVLKNFDFAIHTDKGRVRERNEDNVAYFDTINGHAFVVCDGMGGHNAGDIASEIAVESISDYLNEKFYPNPFEAVENSIINANKSIYKHALGNDYLQGMGTTIVLALIRDDRIYYGHVGDSRLYLYRNNVLDQMTEDHSIVQQLLKGGLITAKEAKEHPKRNEITRALGLSIALEPEVSPRAIIPQNDDFLLICSDGLTNLVGPNEISKVLNNPYNVNDKAVKLVSKANKKGGIDNISIILARFHNLEDQEDALDDFHEWSAISMMRNILRNRKFTFFLVFLFIIGTSIILFRKEEVQPKEMNKKFVSEEQLKIEDLIIPYRLKDDEIIDNLAEKFNIEVETIRKLNPNYDIYQKDTHLKIPVSDLYVVRQNDEIELIAATYGIDVIDIMKANDMESRNLMVGAELIIPLKK
jgi:serine/threonine protein phosphatase PrpC